MLTRQLVIVILLLGFVVACLFWPTFKYTSTLAQTSDGSPIPLINFLAQMGKNRDCFFTIEYVQLEKEDSKNSIVNQWVRLVTYKDCREAVERLRQTIPGLTYRINAANPRVIHIIDARFPDQKGNEMETVIKNIDYEGRLMDLPSAINKKGIAISSPLVTFTGETNDYKTMVHVKGERLKVRDALSNFVPLDGRAYHILWIATTRPTERMTYIRYP